MTPDIPALKAAIDAYIQVVGPDIPVLADAYPKPGVPRITAADLRSLIEYCTELEERLKETRHES